MSLASFTQSCVSSDSTRITFLFGLLTSLPAHGDLHYQVSGDAFHPFRKTLVSATSTRLILFLSSHSLESRSSPLGRPASFSETPHSSLRRDPPPMTCMTQRREGNASPPPSSSFHSIQIFAAFLLHLFHSDISTNRAFAAQVAEPLLMFFFPDPSSP